MLGYIGAGKVSKSMALYQKSRGFEIGGFYSRTVASAQTAAALTGSKVYDSVSELTSSCSIIFIATPDDAISGAAQAVSDSICSLSGKTVIHFSGALSSSSLDAARQKGAAVFSVHPPLPFSGVITDAGLLDSLIYTAEGQGDAGIIENLFPNVRYILPEQKPLYHAAMCILSNYTVTLANAAQNILTEIGLELSPFFPLLDNTLNNICVKGAEQALTGPIARGDTGTVQKHLAALGPPELKQLYATLGRATASDALKSHFIDEATYLKLKEALTCE